MIPAHIRQNHCNQEIAPAFQQSAAKLRELNPSHAYTLSKAKEDSSNFIGWTQKERFEQALLGGWYADLDIEWYAPLPLLPAEVELVVAIERHGSITDAFFACVPSHPLVVAMVGVISKEGIEHKTSGQLLRSIGVNRWSALFRDHYPGIDLFWNPMLDRAAEDFARGDVLHEEGVLVLPFDAISRHSKHNWLGWHQCHGSWRPRREDGSVDMGNDAKLPT